MTDPVRHTHSLEFPVGPPAPHTLHIVHLAQIRGAVDDHQRQLDLPPGLLVLCLRLDVLEGARAIIRAGPHNRLGSAEDVGVMIDGVVRAELLDGGRVGPPDAFETLLAPLVASDGSDQLRCIGCGEEGPVEVADGGGGVGEGPPLLGGGDDVEQDGGLEVVGGVGVDEETVADAAAAVVADPDDGSVVAEEGLEGFDEEGADGAFV
ncbi:hypothetical protein Tdes44962_MAKER09632 [Teratosphaeria destructans]|uniref:Uncharacterized protein n=1 Tax=Teratosphaeria destructans TaxID=418781 RepID=A0A9W7SS93_9PEZI|nr:hypothetical protein Tdes44962_MAKER09632 [Teratosphaeria destructans]